MEVEEEKTKMNLSSIVPEKTVMTKLNSIPEQPQQSVLKKSINNQTGAIWLKTLQGPNGNVIVHGPHNKILALQIKKGQKLIPNSSALSFLPITLTKDSKNGNIKLPNVTLSSVSKFNSSSTKPLTISSTLSNSILASNNLEIKPITVTNSPKPLTPAQAATVPITLTQMDSSISISKIPKTNIEKLSVEKKVYNNKRQAIKIKSIDNASVKTILDSATGKMINEQISNGKKMSAVNGNIDISDGEEKTTQKKDGNEEATTTDENSLIRVRSIESLQTNNKQIKPKQKSLLKNKRIEKLQRSPRTTLRSKSLNLATTKREKISMKPRRLSAGSENIENVKINLAEDKKSSHEETQNKKTSNLESILECVKQVKKCPSETRTSTISSTSDSPASLSSSSSHIEIKSEIIDLVESSDLNSVLSFEEDTNSNYIESEIFNIPKWIDGIGSINESKLQFQLNEFGLVETLGNLKEDLKLFLDINYDKPIFERDIKSQKPLDNAPLFFCEGCNCHGAAVDFFVPDFCSRKCIQQFNQKSIHRINSKSAKKYTNRRKNAQINSQTNNEMYSDMKMRKIFSWESYLKTCQAEAAAINLFLNPFPCSTNRFQVGMKLEAIDPEHSSLFCVCTIVEKRGFRLKLHFDGYSKFYDYWVNADSMDIFPPGWCSKTNRILQPPKGMTLITFNWPTYLNSQKSQPAPRNLFTHLNSSSNTNPFQIGMKIEADDLRNTGKACVASVADVLDNRILVHFDGWDDSYNYWIDISSPYIHPINWHKKNGFSIVAPPEWSDWFSWKLYLAATKSIAATDNMFQTREPISFQPGMKLEVVDKRNPSLIRPASVVMTDEYEVKVLFEGWPMEYAFWVEDDSPDIHPIGWCRNTDHELEAPPGYENLPVQIPCLIPGCRGIGNGKKSDINFHASFNECPYEKSNWHSEIDKSRRLDEYKKSFPETLKKRKLIESNTNAKKPKIRTVENLPENLNNDNDDDNEKKEINISRHLLCDYGPRLEQVHKLWKRNSECLTKDLSDAYEKNPLQWNADEVQKIISKLPKCENVANILKREDVNGCALLSLRQTDLTDLNVKLGPAIKVYNYIVQLREVVETKFLNL